MDVWRFKPAAATAAIQSHTSGEGMEMASISRPREPMITPDPRPRDPRRPDACWPEEDVCAAWPWCWPGNRLLAISWAAWDPQNDRPRCSQCRRASAGEWVTPRWPKPARSWWDQRAICPHRRPHTALAIIKLRDHMAPRDRHKDLWPVSGTERSTTSRRERPMPMECTPTICSTRPFPRTAPREAITRRPSPSKCHILIRSSSNYPRSNMCQLATISRSPRASSAECPCTRAAMTPPVWPAVRATAPRITATSMVICPTPWTWAMWARVKIPARRQVCTPPARRSSVYLNRHWTEEEEVPAQWISSMREPQPTATIISHRNRPASCPSPATNRSRRISSSPPITSTATREWTTGGTFKWTRHITQPPAQIPSTARWFGDNRGCCPRRISHRNYYYWATQALF